ncbi:MAG: hypothetical protein NZ958_05470 [Bacteroidia bacterium]|nr:hypothetical protein [Bacteroidia bacterium]MDW8088969.1 hypothetical protein [Bacteroidia bacterium]
MPAELAEFLRQKGIEAERWWASLTPEAQAYQAEAFATLGAVAYAQRWAFYFSQWRRLYPLSKSGA